jgi:hypothetical protein
MSQRSGYGKHNGKLGNSTKEKRYITKKHS